MLRTFTDLRRMSIGATDGDIGSIKDAYFDDHEWTLRYLVAAPGSWLSVDRVLITPFSIRGVEWDDKRVDLALTREQVRNAPGIDTDLPVSRQQEAAYFDYYSYPHYWAGPYLWGPVGFPLGMEVPIGARDAALNEARRQRVRAEGDPHLRSANEVSAYRIEATDGSIGHVEDFLFDDGDWSLRHFVVDTRNWLPGRKVLVATDWVGKVSWAERSVHVALLRDEVRNSPEYHPDAFTQSDEEALYRHYGRVRTRLPPQIQIR